MDRDPDAGGRLMDDPNDSIPTPPEPEPASPASDLDAVRDLVLRAHPQAVAELIRGETIPEILASVAMAEAAYARIAASVTPMAPVAPPVPAGGNPPVAIDPDRLPATEKIRRGIAAQS
jgi:hypothetical protein